MSKFDIKAWQEKMGVKGNFFEGAPFSKVNDKKEKVQEKKTIKKTKKQLVYSTFFLILR